MPFSVATWNINSVRLRLPLVLQFLADHQPDVLCLQETKCPDELFPRDAFREAGTNMSKSAAKRAIMALLRFRVVP